jgi:IMP dehydrogenase
MEGGLTEQALKKLEAFRVQLGLSSLDELAEFLSPKRANELGLALSFDDVTLDQGFGDFLPQEADVSTKISRNVKHNIPIISAAMDTITESRMAIEIAQLGGSGVIHRNLPIEEQVDKADKVKKAWNLVVEKPLTVRPNQTVRDVKKIMLETRFGGLPVVRGKRVMVGIVTAKDVKYFSDLDTRVEDMMTPISKDFHFIKHNRKFSQQDYFKRAEQIFEEYRIDHLPVIVKENRKFILKGLITYEDVRKRRKYKDACLRDDRLVVGAAVGCQLKGKGNDIERAEALVQEGKVDYLVIDASHGFCKGVIDTLKALKEAVDVDIIAGNICNGAAAKALIDADADGLKVGVGPGSICTTRQKSGAGIPQITATRSVVLAANKYDIPVITDGGLKYPGHITKSIAAGARAIMLGSMLAGTYETPGKVIEKDGKRVKIYRGMGSLDAMLKGSADRYSEVELMEDLDLRDDVTDLPLEQGISTTVPYKGKVYKIINDCVQGLKHGMGLTGCKTIDILRDPDKYAERFKQITAAGKRESDTHILDK